MSGGEMASLLLDHEENESSLVRPAGHHIPVACGVMLSAFLLSKLLPAMILHIVKTFCKDCERLSTFLHGFLSELTLLAIPLFIAVGIDSSSLRTFISFWPSKHTFHCFCYIVASSFLSLALVSPTHCERNPVALPFDIFEALLNKCLLPAICEEVAFRGWMFHALRESTNSVVSGIATALLFGLFHPWKSVIATGTITLFSCCWTYANEDTNSLLPSIASHFTHNFALSVLTMLDPDVCQTSKFISFIFWICGTIVVFLTIECFQEPQIPQALAG
jgi:membrane protease YdiL (CAAX protease family)